MKDKKAPPKTPTELAMYLWLANYIFLESEPLPIYTFDPTRTAGESSRH